MRRYAFYLVSYLLLESVNIIYYIGSRAAEDMTAISTRAQEWFWDHANMLELIGHNALWR